MKKTLRQLAQERGIPFGTFFSRYYHYGWTLEKALTVPPRKTRTHGQSNTKVYKVWRSMIQRCQCPTDQSFYRYGGRGITVCQRWMKFENFIADMGERPLGGTLERKNVNEGYCPENCTWADMSRQQRNRRDSVFVMLNGKKNQITDLAEKHKINRNTLFSRLKIGYPAELAVIPPDPDSYLKRIAFLADKLFPWCVFYADFYGKDFPMSRTLAEDILCTGQSTLPRKVLKHLVQSGRIVLVEKGKGSKASVYCLADKLPEIKAQK